MKHPYKVRMGGQDILVEIVESLPGSLAGQCYLHNGVISIANKVRDGLDQSETSKINTFYHELVHCILDTMGEYDLSSNEKFVSCFAGFLTEAMQDAKFD